MAKTVDMVEWDDVSGLLMDIRYDIETLAGDVERIETRLTDTHTIDEALLKDLQRVIEDVWSELTRIADDIETKVFKKEW